jgi:hypothetical protein
MRQAGALILTLALASVAWGQLGSITDGTATFEFADNALHEGFGNYTAGGSDQMFQNWWWFRVDGDTAETAFPWAYSTPAGPDNESWGTNAASLDWNTSIAAFDARLSLTINQTMPDTATVWEEMMITNTGSTDLVLALYNYLDLDAAGTVGGDEADLSGPDTIVVRDGTDFVEFQGVNADAYQVTTYSTLRTELRDDNIDNLNNTGVPFGPADFTGAFQWNLTIPAGETRSVMERISINIPEPASLLLLALAGLVLRRR